MSEATAAQPFKEHLVMADLVSLNYSEQLTPNLQRFADHLIEGRLVGHKSPSGMVYLPGKGYDPLTLDITTEADEVEVSDHGTLTGYTIVTPVAYYGQSATEPFVVASVLLDGCDNAIGQQDILNVPHDELRVGLRVKAVWFPESERNVDAMTNRGVGGFLGVIEGFEPNGEPDASIESIKEHLF
ncbi:MAG TPA: OB-fold domain-containing protein [Ilumatobacter sp.]|nr:OB-fold domain-containing protein [Ilumatobacter sp.]